MTPFRGGEAIRLLRSDLHIGAAMADITGPAAEVGMFGYANSTQHTAGIHMRLRARAFVFQHQGPPMTTCAMVVCDLGMVSEWVSQRVVTKLQTHRLLPNALFSRENVMLSAIHTHCAPGGLSHYFMYSMHPPLRGADRQFLKCVVDGIVSAIVQAYMQRQPAAIRVAQGECLGASVNRSALAYMANPEEERAKYAWNTDKTMTLWRLDGINGFPIGMINWFAVHPTNMGGWFKLITGDNKGYAAHVFEEERGTRHLMDRPRQFVAAFAQTNSGDVSPNIHGPRDESTQQHDFERMVIVANAQLETARRLYTKAANATPLTGAIQRVHQYVQYGNVQLRDKWQLYKDECPASTSSGCIGVSMMGGTTFDGRGIKQVPEGLKWGDYPKITTMPSLQSLQREKLVFFPTARYGMSPTVLPLQLFVIAGCLPVAAVPFEMTTMAGRRLRSTLRSAFVDLGNKGMHEPVLSCLSNAYSGYLTTREEYAVQRYEGASTHFGPNQLCATQQQFEILAQLVCGSTKVEYATLPPPSIGGIGTIDYNIPVVHDGLVPNAAYGDVIADTLKEYTLGSRVIVSFHGAHPKNNLRTQDTFLEVHRWVKDETRNGGGEWVMHTDDGDPNTFFRWNRNGTFASIVTLEWIIPPTTTPGRYRIKVNGDFKSFITGSVSSYCGYSSPFIVLGAADGA